jgi:hypothetical protein
MVEETKKAEETKQEISPIEEAKKAIEENKKVLEEMKAERVKIEKASADLMLQGRGFAGKTEEKKEETPKDYMNRIMKGG